MIVRDAINALTYIKDFHPIACCNVVQIHMSNNPNWKPCYENHIKYTFLIQSTVLIEACTHNYDMKNTFSSSFLTSVKTEYKWHGIENISGLCSSFLRHGCQFGVHFCHGIESSCISGPQKISWKSQIVGFRY